MILLFLQKSSFNHMNWKDVIRFLKLYTFLSLKYAPDGLLKLHSIHHSKLSWRPPEFHLQTSIFFIHCPIIKPHVVMLSYTWSIVFGSTCKSDCLSAHTNKSFFGPDGVLVYRPRPFSQALLLTLAITTVHCTRRLTCVTFFSRWTHIGRCKTSEIIQGA